MQRAIEARSHGGRGLPLWVRAGRRLRRGVVRLLGRRDHLGPATPAEAPSSPDTPSSPAAPSSPEAPSSADTTVEVADPAHAEITEMTATIARYPVRPAPLITVLFVTTGEPGALDAAVESVRAQSYDAWELVVVDDRSPPAPPGVPAPGDGRVRVLAGPRLGAAAAHNRGLETASGQIVTYLSDGTHMAPGWLAALAWASDEYPGTELFAGIRGVFTGAALPDPAASLARLVGEDRIRVLTGGGGDDHLSALAHRRELAGARVAEGTGVDPDKQPAMVVAAIEHGIDPRRIPFLASLALAPAVPTPVPPVVT